MVLQGRRAPGQLSDVEFLRTRKFEPARTNRFVHAIRFRTGNSNAQPNPGFRHSEFKLGFGPNGFIETPASQSKSLHCAADVIDIRHFFLFDRFLILV